MKPTDKLRDKLRKLLDEKIPEDGLDTDTRFLDKEINDLLEEAGSVYQAAVVGWTMKAGMYQKEMADIEETTAGQERYKLTSLKGRMEYALKMAETYSVLACKETSIGSVVLKLEKPEVY